VADLAIHGDALWARFTGGRDGSLWYYRSLVTVFRTRIDGPGCERFASLVQKMSDLAGRKNSARRSDT
jgi:hypothetical protein